MAAQSNKPLKTKILHMVRQEAMGTALLVLLAVAFVPQQLPSALLGILAGWGDVILVLWGIWTGMQKEAPRAAAHMHRLMLVRILFLLGLTVVTIRSHWNPVLLFAGFLLYHVFFFIQLVQQPLDVKK